MRVAFDTSVLVAALIESHPRHAAASEWVAKKSRIERIASAHAMAEGFSVLTRLPGAALPPGVAWALVSGLRKHISFVPPTLALYAAAIERCIAVGVQSGAAFDALHVVTAEREEADSIVTLNEAHFARLRIAKSPAVVVPI